MNNKYGLIGVIMTVLIGIILVGSVLAPTIADIQETVGEEVTYSNVPEGYEFPYYDYYTEDTTIVFSYPEDSTSNAGLTATVNGESVVFPNSWSAFHAIIGDNMSLDIARSTNNTTTLGNLFYFVDDVYTQTTLAIGTWTVVYDVSEGTVTVTDDTNTYTISTANVIGMVVAEEGYVTYTSNNYDDAYVRMDGIEDGTIGVYEYNGSSITVGDNTVSAFIVANSGGLTYTIVPNDDTNTLTYSAKINVTGLTLVDGTTDIYSGGTPTFIITDSDGTSSASLTPIKSLVIDEVEGHSASGTEYTLYGVVVVLFIVSLFAGAVTSILRRGEN